MKKLSVLCLVLLSVLMICSAVLADAEFTAVEESLIIYEGESNGYFFAKVENTGDTGAYIDSGNLDILDAEGELILNNDWVLTAPSSQWIEPGETAYVRQYLWDSALADKEAASFEFTIPGGRNWGYRYHTIPCEAEFYFEGSSFSNVIFVTFTNTTTEMMHDFTVTGALYDENDNLVFVVYDSFDEIGIHPGSSVTLVLDVDYSLSTYLVDHDMTPARVEAVTYISDED